MDLILCRVADALDMHLKRKQGVLSGRQRLTLATDISGLKLPLHVSVVAGIEAKQTGALVRIAGNLYLFVVADQDGNSKDMRAHLIDGAQVTCDGVIMPLEMLVSHKHTEAEALKALGVGVIQSFSRITGQWQPTSKEP